MSQTSMSMGTFLGGKVHGGLWKVYAPGVKKIVVAVHK